MTLAGLVVGHHTPVGAELLDWIKAAGCEAIRGQGYADDQRTLTPPEVLAAMYQEIILAGMEPYITIREPEQVEAVPDGRFVGFSNEPDLGSHFNWPNPNVWEELTLEFIDRCGTRVQPFVGCVSNLNDRGYNFLKRLDWSRIPPHVGCDFHRYPDGTEPVPARPSHERLFKGPDHRDEEIAALERLVGPRALLRGEVGYHTSSGLSEQGQAEAMAWERGHGITHGLVIDFAFQLNSGPNPKTMEHQFGFRRVDSMEWRPVASAWFQGGVT